MARRKKDFNPFPMLLEATHVDTGYEWPVTREGDEFKFAGEGELIIVNNDKELDEAICTLDGMYGDAWLFAGVPMLTYLS